MASPITSAEAPDKEGSAWLSEEQPRVKQEVEEDDDDDHGGDERDGGENKPAEHTTINVTNRPEGNIKDDCSDITDNHETEEQSSRTFPQKVSSDFDNKEKVNHSRATVRMVSCDVLATRVPRHQNNCSPSPVPSSVHTNSRWYFCCYSLSLWTSS
jgi:hypothetical protein